MLLDATLLVNSTIEKKRRAKGTPYCPRELDCADIGQLASSRVKKRAVDNYCDV